MFDREVILMDDIKDNQKDCTSNLEDFDSSHLSSKIEEEAKQFYNKIKGDAPNTLNRNNGIVEDFKKRVGNFWKKPLDLLDLYVMYSLAAGSKFNKEMWTTAEQEKDYVFIALTRLHAKACLISQEVLTLMKNGYASGAHARWRSLHEIAVTGSFIKKHGNEVAERYLFYSYIEVYNLFKDYLKDNDLYQNHCDTLGYTPYDSIEDMKKAEIMKEKLCSDDKFSKPFGSGHGWAAKALGKRPCNFKEIEKDVGLDHIRPFYDMANHFVHAGPKGISFNIGISDLHTEKVLLAGPSDSGLADPGSNMVVSLHKINENLLTSRPTEENHIFMRAMGLLLTEINE
jgi:hypothetical protein